MELKVSNFESNDATVPNGWHIRPVVAMGEVVTGKALAKYASGLQRPYLRTKNVFDGRIKIDDVLSMPMTDKEFEHFGVLNGDVLLNEGQSLNLVGRCSLYNGEYGYPCAIQNQLIRFRARPGVSGTFASHLFRYCQQSGIFAKIALKTTSIAHLGGKRFERLELLWPCSENEQRAIATALSDVDALLDGLDRLIAKKRDLKQAAMQQLLTGQTRLPGFEGEWEEKRLDQIADIRSGGTPSTAQPRFWDGGIPWCTPTDITALGGSKYLSESSRTISAAGLQSSSAETIPAHSIIMTTRATIGECAINTVPMTTNQGFKNLIPWYGVSTEFLYYLMTTQTDRMIQLCGGSTFLEIGKKQLSGLVVVFPCDPDEQTEIATVLSDMDAEIEALEQRRAKTADLKQAMMQELLTGKTRLVEPQVASDQTVSASNNDKGHNWAINEAVVIATLAQHFGKEDYPLGRKRYTKLSYLLHRHVERQAEGYLKKAAGPYNPKTKYGGPEKIAMKNGYIQKHKGPKGHSGFIAADNIAQAEGYFEKWYGPDVLQWLEQFRFKKNDDLELLATVDMAVEELRASGKNVDVTSVKDVIRSNPEWKAKLDREVFSDTNIAKGIEQSQALFDFELPGAHHA